MRMTGAEQLILRNQITIMAALQELLRERDISPYDNSRSALTASCSRTALEVQEAKSWSEK